jgi:WD repeat-containing protein 48
MLLLPLPLPLLLLLLLCLAVVSTSASGATWRTSAAAFTGREREREDLPGWVCDAVIRGLLPYVKELKAAFVLHPAEGSSLPSLMQSRLNAPRILQVAKVGVHLHTCEIS